jgi:hypothetical protein
MAALDKLGRYEHEWSARLCQIRADEAERNRAHVDDWLNESTVQLVRDHGWVKVLLDESVVLSRVRPEESGPQSHHRDTDGIEDDSRLEIIELGKDIGGNRQKGQAHEEENSEPDQGEIGAHDEVEKTLMSDPVESYNQKAQSIRKNRVPESEQDI